MCSKDGTVDQFLFYLYLSSIIFWCFIHIFFICILKMALISIFLPYLLRYLFLLFLLVYTYSTKFIHFKNDTYIWYRLNLFFFFYLIHRLKILTEFVLFYMAKKYKDCKRKLARKNKKCLPISVILIIKCFYILLNFNKIINVSLLYNCININIYINNIYKYIILILNIFILISLYSNLFL